MKDLQISKELLSEVLEYEVDTFLGITKNEIDYTCCKDENEGYIDTSINIYEFAFKCKEWAFKKGYEIHTNFNEVVAVFKEVRKLENVGHFKRLPLISWEEIEYDRDTNNEVEAIIKACEWILEYKENQCTK